MPEETTDWISQMAEWQARYPFSTRKPVEARILEQAASELTGFTDPLKAFYQFCNGLTYHWFSVLPIEDPADIKHTWDGIKRANDAAKTDYLGQDEELLQRFLVFASLDAGQCAAIDRTDGAIWFEEDGELHQTGLTLLEFIETCLREVQEL